MTGGVCDVAAMMGRFEPALVRSHAFQIAVEAACSVLAIDEMVLQRQLEQYIQPAGPMGVNRKQTV